MDEPLRTVNVFVEGRVQGVWYRAWTCEKAKSLGLDGWVRNRRNGSVEATLSGPHHRVETMLKLMAQGPSSARVSSLRVEDLDYPPDSGFNLKPTA